MPIASSMKKLLSKIKTDKIALFACITSVLLILINSFYVAISYSSLPPFVPLFNQMPWGEARLSTKEQIFMPIAIVIVITIGNFLLASLLYEKIPLISRILSITIVLVSFFALLFVARTIQLIL